MNHSELYELYKEEIQSITMLSDVFFKIICKDERVVKEIIEAIYDIGLDIYEYKYQEEIKYLHYKGVIFDVIMTSNIGIINLEMESSKYRTSLKRMRYYASMIDVSSFTSSQEYDELLDVKIVFIVNGDPFNKDEQVYHIHRYIDEGLHLCHDGSEMVVVNALKEDQSRLGQILHDLHQSQASNMYNPILKEVMSYYKEDKEGNNIMCEIFDKVKQRGLNEGIILGRNEGMILGRNEGITIGEIQSIKNLMLSLQISLEQAMDILKVSVEKREEYRNIIEQ